jgi:hypothetical protein
VIVETRHVPLAARWDLSFDVSLDRELLFSMTRAPRSLPVPVYLAGTTTAFGFRFARAVQSAEVALTGRAGAARTDAVNDLAANESGRIAAFYDAAIDLRWFAHDMSIVHGTGELLTPIVRAYAGVQHDQRFHRAGDLSGFDDPTGRVLIGAEANPIRIANARDRALLAIGAGIDWEGALRGANRLPSGFRVALRATVDVGASLK